MKRRRLFARGGPEYRVENMSTTKHNWNNDENYVEVKPVVPQSTEAAIKEDDNRVREYQYRKDFQNLDDARYTYLKARGTNDSNRTIQLDENQYIRMLSNPKAKFHTGYVPLQVLDSLSYNWGQNPNTPANVVFGIPNRENGFGVFYKKDYDFVSPWVLNNSHSFRNDPYTNSYNAAMRDYGFERPTAYDETHYSNKVKEWETGVGKELQKYKGSLNKELSKDLYDLNISPYTWAWEWFRRGLYNPGEPGYDQRVINEGNDFVNSPEFKKYWEERGKAMYDKGKAETPASYKQAYKDFRRGGRRSIED